MKKTTRIFPLIFNLLLFSVVLGLFVSNSGLTSMMIHCEMMMEEMPMSEHHASNDTDMEHCPMSGNSEEDPVGSNYCEMEISICGCELQTSNSFATLAHTIKLNPPVLPDFGLISAVTSPDIPDPPPLPVYFSNSYTPPQLFLANESFLI